MPELHIRVRDPWTVLERHHAWVAATLATIERSAVHSPESSRKLLETVRMRALRVARAEERVLYPRVASVPALRPWIEASRDGHDELAASFDSLRDTSDSVALSGAVRSLARAMRRHVELERTCLHPLARRHLDAQETRTVTAALEELLDRDCT